MPIYAYKCESCGFSKDVLQKMSDTPLADCLQCGVASFKKQLTAAGFQLKGSGWYVTDFRGGGACATKNSDAPAGESAGSESKPVESGAATTPAAATTAAAATPAATSSAPASSKASGGDSSSKSP